MTRLFLDTNIVMDLLDRRDFANSKIPVMTAAEYLASFSA